MGAWKVIRILLRTLVATGFLLLPGPALAAEEVSVKELIEQAADLSGEAVTVEGELVGDYGFREDGWMWTQLNGDVYVSEPIREGGSPLGANNGIGIRMPIALAEGLVPPGRYRSRGPVVLATGTWKYHDPERQGESFLEVESLVVVEPGRQLGEEADWRVIVAGALLIGAAAAVWFAAPRQ
jgi:hypothetical protein